LASAASSTSASRHPPPTVPRKLPSARTSIFMVVFPGVEPAVLTIVHRAHGSPAACRRTISAYRSMRSSEAHEHRLGELRRLRGTAQLLHQREREFDRGPRPLA